MDRIEKLCIEKGLRMTGQRRVIARVLSESHDHPDAEELHRRAAAIDAHISIATVYRTVRLLEESGILERHDFRDGRSRYEEAPDVHHDHLIDIQSGNVIEMCMGQKDVIDRRQLGHRQLGSTGAGIDENIVVDQKGSGPLMSAADAAAAAKDA